mmetsp:Transcript_14540/g.51114  ORF Transcript_14540/g.51114 Transcript_14540/m.51114 type:complete len:239 (+) Transcript_14540:821-1537(+)
MPHSALLQRMLHSRITAPPSLDLGRSVDQNVPELFFEIPLQVLVLDPVSSLQVQPRLRQADAPRALQMHAPRRLHLAAVVAAQDLPLLAEAVAQPRDLHARDTVHIQPGRWGRRPCIGLDVLARGIHLGPTLLDQRGGRGAAAGDGAEVQRGGGVRVLQARGTGAAAAARAEVGLLAGHLVRVEPQHDCLVPGLPQLAHHPAAHFGLLLRALAPPCREFVEGEHGPVLGVAHRVPERP